MENMGEGDLVFFLDERIDKLLNIFKQTLASLASASKDIVEAFDFEDDELLTVLGKKDLKDSDEMYSEILRVVRLNPLNKQIVPRGFNKYMRPLIIGKL